jgi:hypothetical protein
MKLASPLFWMQIRRSSGRRLPGQLLRIHDAVEQNRRHGLAHHRRQLIGIFAAGSCSAAGNGVVVYIDGFRKRIVSRVVHGIARGEVTDHRNVGGVVVLDGVLEDLDVIGSQHDHAGAGGNLGHHAALGAEVLRVVLHDFVVEHARVAAALHRQVGQVEHQDAAGVVRGLVVVDVGELRILDLDAATLASARLRRTMILLDWPT